MMAAMVANNAMAIKTTATVFRRRRLSGERADMLGGAKVEDWSHVLHGSLSFVDVRDSRNR